MTGFALLHLPDGRLLEYRIRSSTRNRNLRLRLTAEGLTVSAPPGLSLARIRALVADNSDWIAARLERIGATGEVIPAAPPLPSAIVLPALDETWQVAYQPGPGSTVRAVARQPHTILVAGAVTDEECCRAVLRAWLARRAKESLPPWLGELAGETGLGFSRLSIRNQRSRWGSCSAAGAISLNCRLLFLAPELVRYVLLHELCHTREHNHTARYWSLLHQFEPAAPLLHRRVREAMPLVPAWVQSQRRINRPPLVAGEREYPQSPTSAQSDPRYLLRRRHR